MPLRHARRGGRQRGQEQLLTKRSIVAVLGSAALAIAGLGAGLSSADAAASAHGALHAKRVCAVATTTATAACDAKVLVNAKGVVPNAATPPVGGKTPAQLRDAYKLTGAASGGRTVAI